MHIRPDSLFARHAQQLAERTTAQAGAQSTTHTGHDFLSLIGSGLGEVNEMQNSANLQVEKLLAGEDVQSAEVMTGLQKADMAFRLLVQVRNKLMQAFEEINNIRI
jgi:flagellar hook-basal body complex protein FliE